MKPLSCLPRDLNPAISLASTPPWMHAGTRCYPGTVFTDAPFGVLMTAMTAASGSNAKGAGPQHRGPTAVPSVFSCAYLSCSTAAGVPIVSSLSLSLPYGRAILFEGPSGCGKTTLLRAFAGLHPLTAGTISMPEREQVPCWHAQLSLLQDTATAWASTVQSSRYLGCSHETRYVAQVMILPHRPLVAPGSSLRLQLVYPSTAADSLTDQAAHSLLKRVHLEHLLDRVAGDLDAPLTWAGMLMPVSLYVDVSNLRCTDGASLQVVNVSKCVQACCHRVSCSGSA